MRKLLFAIIVSASVMLGQNPKGRGPGDGQGVPAGPDMSRVETIKGTVTVVNIGYGVEYPNIVIEDRHIKLAPVWFLIENDFEIEPGDTLEVMAARSLKPGDAYFYAIELTAESGAVIVLRDSQGVPQWTGPGSRGQGRPGNGNGGTACIDPASIASATGTVDQVTMGHGIQAPSLVLSTGGNLRTVRIGPERVLLTNGFEIKAGDSLTVRYGKALCTGELLALELTNSDGVTVRLREDSGQPVW